MTQVIVAGVGFAGIWIAKALQGWPEHVTVVDCKLFQPPLYQVAAAALCA